MRTTLDIDADVLMAAKELARLQGVTAGRLVTRLLRAALSGQSLAPEPQRAADATPVAGFRPFLPASPDLVTNAQVEALRDQEGL